MTDYRRSAIAGATYFFTANIAERGVPLLAENVELLRAAFRSARHRHPFTIEAIVVMPDHLHAIWTMPQEDSDFAMRWMLIKAGFSRRLPHDERISASRVRKRKRGIWQRRYWEHVIRDEDDFTRHVDYIHFNPVKHGYVEHVADWPYSSFHRMVRLGFYPENWAESRRDLEGSFGER